MKRPTETRTAIVPTTSQAVGLTREGIPASTPGHLIDAPIEAVVDYLRDPENGAVVLFADGRNGHDFGRLERLLARERIPFRRAER